MTTDVRMSREMNNPYGHDTSHISNIDQQQRLDIPDDKSREAYVFSDKKASVHSALKSNRTSANVYVTNMRDKSLTKERA